MPSASDLRLLLRHPVDFEVGEDPEASRFVFSTPDGQQRARASDAVGPLSQGIRTMTADASVRAWATPAILALRLMAKGELADPAATERSQLHDASRAIDPDPVAARAKVEGFLAALAAESPAVATTPQRDPDRDPGSGRPTLQAPPIIPRERPRARTFSAFLDVSFLDVVDDTSPAPEGPVAEVRLRVKPLDAGWAPADARDLWRREGHHFGAGAREATRLLVGRIGGTWPPALRLPRLLETDAPLLVTAAELADLGSSRVVTLLQADKVEVSWPEELLREVETSATVGPREQPPGRRRAFSSEQLFRFDWQLAVGGDVLTQEEVDELATRHSTVC
ncbi:SNF2 helicase-associated domain-containing protein [Aeromicrobium sp. CTD01-1L150]|uniref:SNF2 helicase-associated domain-containing protein n=1 Tax=Aeromicrobium sp. CTD01-1L150 TaxID=3341830 RepID=UPI0035C15B47